MDKRFMKRLRNRSLSFVSMSGIRFSQLGQGLQQEKKPVLEHRRVMSFSTHIGDQRRRQRDEHAFLTARKKAVSWVSGTIDNESMSKRSFQKEYHFSHFLSTEETSHGGDSRIRANDEQKQTKSNRPSAVSERGRYQFQQWVNLYEGCRNGRQAASTRILDIISG